MRSHSFGVLLCCFVAVSASLAIGGCSARPGDPVEGEWVSPLGRDHPLVGRIYDVSASRFVSRAELDAVAAAADILLLGEQHDNLDHHRLQQSLLDAFVRRGRRPAVAFEQLDLEDQPAVDRALAGVAHSDGAAMSASDSASGVAGRDSTRVAAAATALADAVEWDKSGWPPFEQYRPVFETAIKAGLPIRATNLSRSSLMQIFAHAHGPGPSALPVGRTPAAHAGRVGVPLPNRLRDAMSADIRDSHCGYADERMTEAMIEAQRLRDATMATAVVGAVEDSEAALTGNAADSGAQGGVVVVCGFGHARRDYGIPLYLRAQAPQYRSLSVALLEAAAGAESPADYLEAFHTGEPPFDYLLFTPRTDDDDPCETFRGQLEKMKKKG